MKRKFDRSVIQNGKLSDNVPPVYLTLTTAGHDRGHFYDLFCSKNTAKKRTKEQLPCKKWPVFTPNHPKRTKQDSSQVPV